MVFSSAVQLLVLVSAAQGVRSLSSEKQKMRTVNKPFLGQGGQMGEGERDVVLELRRDHLPELYKLTTLRSLKKLVLWYWSDELRMGSPWPLATGAWYKKEHGGVSERMFDPYTSVHIMSGYASYVFTLGWLSQVGSLSRYAKFIEVTSLVLTILFGLIFEAFENSNKMIEEYRKISGTSRDYEGDTGMNVVGDMLAMVVGWAVAQWLVDQGLWYLLVLIAVFQEVFMVFYMRDNFLITTYGVLSGLLGYEVPKPFLNWQAAGLPPRERLTREKCFPRSENCSGECKLKIQAKGNVCVPTQSALCGLHNRNKCYGDSLCSWNEEVSTCN